MKCIYCTSLKINWPEGFDSCNRDLVGSVPENFSRLFSRLELQTIECICGGGTFSNRHTAEHPHKGTNQVEFICGGFHQFGAQGEYVWPKVAHKDLNIVVSQLDEILNVTA